MAKNVTFNGVEYKSPLAVAKVLVNEGKKPSQAVKILSEAGIQITPQSVYAYTSGAEKTAARRAKYRILNLGKSGRKTVGEIAKRTGTSTSKVVSMLKKAGIAIVTKEALAKAAAEAAKQAEKEAKAAERKAARKAKKETAKAETEPVADEPVAEVTEEVAEDQAAMEAALVDMAADGELD